MGSEAAVLIFESHGERLRSIAYRTLGSHADAEDAVQEAWLRLERQEPTTIENLPAWLTTVVGRICIDKLRSRSARREVYFQHQLSELVVSADESLEDQAAQTETVGIALLIMMERLTPDERIAWVLHDVFAVPFAQIGQIIGKSVDASKMLASRARRKLQATPVSSSPRQQHQVVDAFLAAAQRGDFKGLLEVLDPDVLWTTHTRHGVNVRSGAEEVAGSARKGSDLDVISRRVVVNGDPGILVWDRRGRPRAFMACVVGETKIVEIHSVVDRLLLMSMRLPPPPVVSSSTQGR